MGNLSIVSKGEHAWLKNQHDLSIINKKLHEFINEFFNNLVLFYTAVTIFLNSCRDDE